MPLFFSLSQLRESLHSGNGLEVRIHLKTYYGQAEDIRLEDFQTSLKRLMDDGLQGISHTALDCFLGADVTNSLNKRSYRSVAVDLDALSKCFPELASRKWLPEHFQQPSEAQPREHTRREGDLSLLASHFYDDPDAWGYVLSISIWFPDNILGGTIAPARQLYISNKGAIQDSGEFSIEQEHVIESIKEIGSVFVSYVREDASLIMKLAADLQTRGITVWLDRDRILPGDDWREAIRNAIQGGAAFIACFSSNYANRNKTYMNEELQLAFAELRKMQFGRAWFIPVLISPCEVPNYEIGPTKRLADLHHVSLYEDWDISIQRIVATIKQTHHNSN